MHNLLLFFMLIFVFIFFIVIFSDSYSFVL